MLGLGSRTYASCLVTSQMPSSGKRTRTGRTLKETTALRYDIPYPLTLHTYWPPSRPAQGFNVRSPQHCRQSHGLLLSTTPVVISLSPAWQSGNPRIHDFGVRRLGVWTCTPTQTQVHRRTSPKWCTQVSADLEPILRQNFEIYDSNIPFGELSSQVSHS